MFNLTIEFFRSFLRRKSRRRVSADTPLAMLVMRESDCPSTLLGTPFPRIPAPYGTGPHAFCYFYAFPEKPPFLKFYFTTLFGYIFVFSSIQTPGMRDALTPINAPLAIKAPNFILLVGLIC